MKSLSCTGFSTFYTVSSPSLLLQFVFSCSCCYGAASGTLHFLSRSLLLVCIRSSIPCSDGDLCNVASQIGTMQMGAVEEYVSHCVRIDRTSSRQLQQHLRNCYTTKQQLILANMILCTLCLAIQMCSVRLYEYYILFVCK